MFEWFLDDDRQTVTLSISSEPPVVVTLDAAAVAALIEMTGEIRATMMPEVPRTLTFGQLVQAIRDPIWRTEPEVMVGASTLHIRDPRYGWLHYVLPREEARELSSLLQAQVDTPPPDEAEANKTN